MLEICDRVVGEVGPEHEADGLWIEQAATGKQREEFCRRCRLPSAEGAVQPDDHWFMLGSVEPSILSADGTAVLT